MSALDGSRTLFELLGTDETATAIVAPGRSAITYGQLRANALELAATLAGLGLGRGDRIAIAMTNGPDLITAFFGVAIAATAAPLNPKYKADEFAFYYADTSARALVTVPDAVPAAVAAMSPGMMLLSVRSDASGRVAFDHVAGEGGSPRPVELATPDDVAMILHTSGTTSRPKRVPLRHRNLAASTRNITATYGLSAADRALCVMPLFHIHGLVGSMMSTLASGGTLICPPGFSALEFWSLVETFQPTWYSAVPTMHQMLLTRADRHEAMLRTHPMRFIRSSSAPLPPIVLERLERAFGSPVLESYGMTEASHQMASNPLPPRVHKPGSVGVGVGVDIGIMDDAGHLLGREVLGEVVVRGPNVIDGYENNPEANATAFVDGWFRTGDRGLIDADGYVVLAGRLKELINRGGEKISPLEIDDVLLRHPAVLEALAFAVPHRMLGEDIHAVVVFRPDAHADDAELRAHCAATLAEFKVPRRFHALKEIPRGPTGKLQRIAMAKLLQLTEE